MARHSSGIVFNVAHHLTDRARKLCTLGLLGQPACDLEADILLPVVVGDNAVEV
jgi:hypothetical protein